MRPSSSHLAHTSSASRSSPTRAAARATSTPTPRSIAPHHLAVPATFALALLALTACLPEVAADLTTVDTPRILAVAADPAEVGPNKLTTLTALYADADGTITVAPLDWAVCTARRRLAELGPVDPDCLEQKNKHLLPLPRGLSVPGKVPQDACRLFGPDPPPAAPGEPAGRPVDPDVTGGYYQPLRVIAEPGDPTLVRLRLACGLAGATQQQAADYRKRYLPNLAPAVTLERDEEPVPEDSLTVAPGAELSLRARWPACPTTPACGDAVCSLGEPTTCPDDCAVPGCRGAETYLRFDPTSLTLVEQREAISLAWYATAGSFAAARTGRAGDDPGTFSDNPWTAPDEPGDHTLWIVIRDDRGAAAWQTLRVRVAAP